VREHGRGVDAGRAHGRGVDAGRAHGIEAALSALLAATAAGDRAALAAAVAAARALGLRPTPGSDELRRAEAALAQGAGGGGAESSLSLNCGLCAPGVGPLLPPGGHTTRLH
jgi:hypothetical protein